jgi:hypothetical protein
VDFSAHVRWKVDGGGDSVLAVLTSVEVFSYIAK